MVMSPRMIVVIDELRLRGVEPRQRRTVGEALERELERLFQSYPGASRRAGRIDHIAAPPVALRPGTSTSAFALRLAERIYEVTVAATARPRGVRGRP